MNQPSRTLIIAEAGVNHNGDIRLAEKLIDVAIDAGADYVKFQTFIANEVVTPTGEQADYQSINTGVKETQLEMLSRLELTDEEFYQLSIYAKKNGIGFCSTPFDQQSVDFLHGLGVELFKVPSGEITNLPLLQKIAGCQMPVILSTGMSVLGEIESAIEVLVNYGLERNNITLLHCTTEYPAPIDEVNLKAMQTLMAAFNLRVGYSDHTMGIAVPVAAVALGACVIEKHFTIDRSMVGPDHTASLESEELKLMISSIRLTERALGDGVKRVTSSEKKNIPIARRSLVAKCAIKKGERFNEDNICAKRPGTGISPMRYYDVIGRVASRNFFIDDLIEV